MAFTYFFRDINVLKAAVEKLAPLVQHRSQVTIWNPGCAYGQEPYSLAILLAQRFTPRQLQKIHIYATDIDISSSFGSIIEAGTYPYSDLERIPKDLFKRWFEPGPSEGKFTISASLRSLITYRQHDLLSLTSVVQGASLILTKNCTMHFNPQQRLDVFKLFYNTLHSHGLLALGQPQDLPEHSYNKLFTRVDTANLLFVKASSKQYDNID